MGALILLWREAIHARDGARRAEAAARVETTSERARAGLEAVAARSVEEALTQEVALTASSKDAADEISTAAGADAPVPPDVLRRWALSIDRLRGGAAADAHSADAPDPANPEVAVPTTR